MKVERTKNGNIKIVMSEEAAQCVADLLGNLPYEKAIKYTTGERFMSTGDVWQELNDLLQEGNK